MEDQKVADERAREIIAKNVFMTLATCGKDGKPWASPVNYAVDKHYNFYFVSSKKSQHVKNIMENQSVSFAVFDSRARGDDIDGVQVTAKARVITGLELLSALKVIFTLKARKPRPKEDFLGIAKKRVVKVIPTTVYKYDRTSEPGEDLRQNVSLK